MLIILHDISLLIKINREKNTKTTLFLNDGNSSIIGKLGETLCEESVGSRFLGGWRRQWAQIVTFCVSTNEKFV